MQPRNVGLYIRVCVRACVRVCVICNYLKIIFTIKCY